MRKVTFRLVVLGVLALAFISMPMRAQNQGYPFPGFPPQFAPSRTSRPRPTPGPLPANQRQLTFGAVNPADGFRRTYASNPVWSPNGTKIAFSGNLDYQRLNLNV